MSRNSTSASRAVSARVCGSSMCTWSVCTVQWQGVIQAQATRCLGGCLVRVGRVRGVWIAARAGQAQLGGRRARPRGSGRPAHRRRRWRRAGVRAPGSGRWRRRAPRWWGSAGPAAAAEWGRCSRGRAARQRSPLGAAFRIRGVHGRASGRGDDERDDFAAVSAVNVKVTVQRQHRAGLHQLRHANKAGIGQGGRHIVVALEQGAHGSYLLGE
jgi:hypothetical protein